MFWCVSLSQWYPKKGWNIFKFSWNKEAYLFPFVNSDERVKSPRFFLLEFHYIYLSLHSTNSTSKTFLFFFPLLWRKQCGSLRMNGHNELHENEAIREMITNLKGLSTFRYLLQIWSVRRYSVWQGASSTCRGLLFTIVYEFHTCARFPAKHRKLQFSTNCLVLSYKVCFFPP